MKREGAGSNYPEAMPILKKFLIPRPVYNYLPNLAVTKVVQVKLYIIPSKISVAIPASGTTIFTTGTTR